MPPKTRKFLDVIYEKLYRNETGDLFLVFEESDFRKAGFSVGEIEEILVFLKKQGIVLRYNSYSISREVDRLPITREDKARRLKWSWGELFAGSDAKIRYVIELVSRDGFMKIYNQPDSSSQRGVGGDGGKVFIVAKEIKGHGKILANGGDGSIGGKGGEVHIVAGKNEYTGEISTKGGESSSPPVFNVKDSQLHFGIGDNIGRDKNKNSKQSLLEKYWWGFLIPILVGLIIYFITNGEIPRLLNISKTPNYLSENKSVSSTVNIWNILSRADGFGTTLEKENFLEKYKSSEIYGAGSFNDINKVSESYYVFVYIGKYPVACSFENVDSQIERKLLLLQKGDTVSFKGTFMSGSLNGVAWYVRSCYLLSD